MLLNLLLDQAAAPAAAAADGAGAQPQGGGYMGIFMIVALIAIFYFFMIRPQQKRQKQMRQFRESLKKGSPVVTAGGIMGTIVDVAEKYFIISIADGVKIRIDKNSVYPSAEEAGANAQEKK